MLECFSTLHQPASRACLRVGLTACEPLFVLGAMGFCYVPRENSGQPEARVQCAELKYHMCEQSAGLEWGTSEGGTAGVRITAGTKVSG